MTNNNSQNELLESALQYREKFNFSVLPIKPDKKPFIKWEPFQKRLPTKEEIVKWWTQWPNAMIGIVTGQISGVVVLDIDRQEALTELSKYFPSCQVPTAKTPRGGWHFYFKPPEKPISNNAGAIPGVDFRGGWGLHHNPALKK